MPFVIPIFIPHQGCPHACIFCNQHRITGRTDLAPVTPERVAEIISAWLSYCPDRRRQGVQVAFYGGSFTGLPDSRQEELLAAAAPFRQSGRVRELRLSTRPDYIDADRLSLLGRYGVNIVELGVQSMDDTVLSASERGHSSEQVREAVTLLRQNNFRTGLQLMVGLPLETTRSLLKTVREVIGLRPDFVRIYPVLVIEGSRLAGMYRQGAYRPLTLAEAVARTVLMKKYFDNHGIKVVRMGLQPGAELEESLAAGPYHPAFGELVRSRMMLRRTRKALLAAPPGLVRLSISARDLSVFRGMRSANINRLEQLGLLQRLELATDADQPRNTLKIL